MGYLPAKPLADARGSVAPSEPRPLGSGAICALACCVFFLAAGVVFVPLLGIENDESLFGSAIWAPSPVNSIQVAGHEIPLMLMSYLGALKGWLYVPLFRIWAPGPYSIRIP